MRANTASGRILAIDDEFSNLKLLKKTLEASGYQSVELVQDPRQAVAAYQSFSPDLILLDLKMPVIDGFAIMAGLRALNDPMLPPVIVLTAQPSQETLLRALREGARDFVAKPFDQVELLLRVRNNLEMQLAYRRLHSHNNILDQEVIDRTQALRRTRLEVVQRLGRAAEYRDNETGMHILRMSHVAELLARALGWNESQCETLLHAAPMHDIGKIGIADHILLKPGKLAPDEWEIMKTHAEIGASILEGGDSDLLKMGRVIALSHHEKWDGSGYPYGLQNEAIPMEGRIVALADVFDALTSERPYKKAWSIEDAVGYVRDNSGKHFDPLATEAFLDLLPQVLEIRTRFAEPA